VHVVTDNRSYSVDVRCPPGLPVVWYTKATGPILAPEQKQRIVDSIKAQGLNVDQRVTISYENCPEFKPTT
jgi:hypothetical protein